MGNCQRYQGDSDVLKADQHKTAKEGNKMLFSLNQKKKIVEGLEEISKQCCSVELYNSLHAYRL